jgi:hypothetical protein
MNNVRLNAANRPVVGLGHPRFSQRDEQLVGLYRTVIALYLPGNENWLLVTRETDVLSTYN